MCVCVEPKWIPNTFSGTQCLPGRVFGFPKIITFKCNAVATAAAVDSICIELMVMIIVLKFGSWGEKRMSQMEPGDSGGWETIIDPRDSIQLSTGVSDLKKKIAEYRMSLTTGQYWISYLTSSSSKKNDLWHTLGRIFDICKHGTFWLTLWNKSN